MPEYIGPVEIPEITASGTFPVTLPWGAVRVLDPRIVVHPFGTGDLRIEQRFYVGPGQRRFSVNLAGITLEDRAALQTFFNDRKGSYQPFTLAVTDADGTPTNVTVRFASPGLSLSRIEEHLFTGGLEFVEEPTTAPTYTSTSTLTRFPGSTLATALLGQAHEVVPVLEIVTADHTIRLSDRRMTLDSQLHQPRLLDFGGITQTMGGAADLASFTLGNADRVLADLVNAVDLDRARVLFAIYHVGTQTRVNLWSGHVADWRFDSGPEFHIDARDGVTELRLAYPRQKISRQAGFDVPNQPVNVGGKKGISRITATSVANDTAYGRPLKDVWVNDSTTPMPVECEVIAGRDESEFYAALGVIGRGPISGFGSGHTLDNQPNHGPGALGLRRSYGGNPSTGAITAIDNSPDAGSDSFALDEVGNPLPEKPLDGVAFLQIRRNDEKGIQPIRPQAHEMVAYISGGLGGWVWSGAGPYTRTWAGSLTNPVWVAINTYLHAIGKLYATQSVQEGLFDVAAAIAAASICNATVDKLIGEGTETQFRFAGIVGREERPLADVLSDILSSCLGYWTNTAGKLRIGIRINSSTVEAFTAGNILHGSLALSARQPAFNDLMVSFADADYRYQQNTVSLVDTDHVERVGQTLKANVNLLGVTGKSQAARICTVALREALGGVSAAEQRAARRISFRTTILALNTEPGMVCSLTHELMPGGSGEFRVTGWRLNPDWSIDIEGETTTDTMYDLTEGPKPEDIQPEPLPDLNPADPVLGTVAAPGHVTDLQGAGGAQITIRGQVWNEVIVTGTAPAADEYRNCDGIEVWAYDSAGAEEAIGHLPFDVGAGEEFEVSFLKIAEEGDTLRTWQIVACARNRFAMADRATAPSDSFEVATKDAAPKAPTGVDLEVVDRGGSLYGLRSTWTPPDPAGATIGYNHEARFFSDSGGSTPVSDWIALGDITGVATASMEAGPFARQPGQVYVRTRLRGFSPFGTFSDWANSPVEEVNPGTGGTGNVVAGVGVTVIDGADNTFGLRTTWTKPGAAGGIVGYHREARYFTDSGGATPDSDWIPLGVALGYNTQTMDSGMWPRPTEDRWVRVRVASYDSGGGRSAWAESSLAKVDPQAAPSAPTAVTVTGLSYGTDKFGLRASWTAPAATSGILQYERQARFYTDSGATTPDSEWIPLGITFPPAVAEDAGPFDRQLAQRWAKVRVRSVAHNGAASAWAESSNVASIAPLNAPPQPAAVAVTIGTAEGPLSYRIQMVVTPNASPGTTDGYQAQARFYTDSGATTPESEWIPLGWIDPAVLTLNTDYWGRPEATRYVKVRVAGQNANTIRGEWRESNIGTVPALALGPGLSIVNNQLANTREKELVNPRFEDDLTGWDYFGGGTPSVVTSGAYAGQSAKLTANGTNQILYQFVAGIVPGQVVRAECYAREDTNSTGALRIQWHNAAGDYIGVISPDTTITGNSWALYRIVGTAPANTAFAVVGFLIPDTATSGALYVDNAALAIEEPVSGALVRSGSSGMTLNYNTGEFSVSGTELTVNSVPMTKATGFSTSEFEISSGAFRVKELAAGKIVTGTLGAGVIYSGAITVAQLTAGTATFSGDVTFARSGGGGSMTLNSSGIVMAGSGLEATSVTANSVAAQLGCTVGINGGYLRVYGAGVTENLRIGQGVVQTNIPAEWRTALGLTTATINYKDHAGNNQSMTVVVLA